MGTAANNLQDISFCTANKDNCSARLFQFHCSSEDITLPFLVIVFTVLQQPALDLPGSQRMCWRSRSSFSTRVSDTTTALAPPCQTGSQRQWLPKHWLVPPSSSVLNGCTASKLKAKTTKKHNSQLDFFLNSVLNLCSTMQRSKKEPSMHM